MVGRFKGAEDLPLLKKAVYYNLAWGLSIGLIGSALYGLLDEQILAIFTDKQNVIDLAMSVVFWTVLAPFVSSICYILDGVFIGATATGPMRNTMLISTFIFFLPIYYIGTMMFGVHGLWLAMVLFMVVRGAALALYLPRTVFKM